MGGSVLVLKDEIDARNVIRHAHPHAALAIPFSGIATGLTADRPASDSG
jgi:hypothetical protein